MQLLGHPSRAGDGIAHRKARPGVELPPNPSGPCPPVRIGGQGRGIIPPRALAPRIAVSSDQTLRSDIPSESALACQPVSSSRRIHREPRPHRTNRRLGARDPIPTEARRVDSAGLDHRHTEVAAALQQQCVQLSAPRLESTPRPTVIGAESLEPLRASPLDPVPRMPQKPVAQDAIRDTERLEHRFHPGVERLAGVIAREARAFQHQSREAGARASDRGRAARWPTTDDQRVDVIHGSPATRRRCEER